MKRKIEQDKCCICWEELVKSESIVLDCGHELDIVCFEKLIDKSDTCPLCRADIDLENLHTNICEEIHNLDCKIEDMAKCLGKIERAIDRYHTTFSVIDEMADAALSSCAEIIRPKINAAITRQRATKRALDKLVNERIHMKKKIHKICDTIDGHQMISFHRDDILVEDENGKIDIDDLAMIEDNQILFCRHCDIIANAYQHYLLYEYCTLTHGLR